MIKKRFLCLVVFLVMTTMANAANEINQKPFEQLILGYNHGVNKSWKNAKFGHLEEYLTQEIYYKTLVWVESYQASNYFMQNILLNMKFDEIVMKQYSATLTTTENWKSRFIDIKTKKVVVPPSKINYKMKYFFVILEDGSWKINHIKILNEKSEEIKE